MTTTPSRPPAVGEVTPLTVHGPAGVVDLTVPARAPLGAVAREYAAQAGTTQPPALTSASGTPLAPATAVEDAGLVPGSVLVAVDPTTPSPPPASARAPRSSVPSPPPAVWCPAAVLVALTAGAAASFLPQGSERLAPVALLALSAVLACVPVGALAAHRAGAAPAFAAAACFAWLWRPDPDQLPVTIGAAALVAAATAAVAALFNDIAEAARVWVVTGVAVFAVSALAVVTSRPPEVVWALLLVTAVLAARWVPLLAVSVPDRYLLDLDLLAVTAWSARDAMEAQEREPRPVPAAAVAAVVARGTRFVTAGAAAVMVVAAAAAPLLLWSAEVRIDRIGARCLVGFGGAALVLAARSHRHPVAKRLLRLGGLACLVSLAVALLADLGAEQRGALAGVAVLVALLVLAAAVLIGRGWRSARWSRNADIAELVCGAAAIGAVVVATGLFRYLWTTTS
jgi:hypothetical protein